MSVDVERFVMRAVTERAASLLLAGPEPVAPTLLRGWLDAITAQARLHAIAITSKEGPWSGAAGLTVLTCDAERSPDQALRGALRMDPDLIVCAAGPTPEWSLLFTAAETGHQVLAHLPDGLAPFEEAAGRFPLGMAFHLGVEADDAGIARLVRFAIPGRAREVLWDRSAGGPLPSELPGRVPPAPPPPPPAPDPLPAEVIAAARAALSERLRPTWTPVLAEPGGEAACSKLGGKPMLARGEPWPTCPGCGLSLPLALQLRREELPAPAAEVFPPGAGWLQLFYCDSPACTCEDPADPAARNRLLRWLPTAGAVAAGAAPDPLGDPDSRSWKPADVRAWEERREAPHSEDLPELDGNERSACHDVREHLEQRRFVREAGGELRPELVDEAELEALGGARSGDKLLGWPAWEQGAEWSACPRCGERRQLLFQLDAWRGRLTALFAADGRGHVCACPAHPEELVFSWACG